MATTVTLKTPDGDMGLYDAEPEGEARAAVIVAQEAFGVNPHIEDVTRRIAAAGYRAVAPHLFHRTGDPVIEYGDFDKVMPQFAGISEAGVAQRPRCRRSPISGRRASLLPRIGDRGVLHGRARWPSWPRCAVLSAPG